MGEDEENGLDEMEDQSLEKKAIDAGKDIARNATKQATNKAKKAVTTFIIAHLPIIIIIIAIIVIVTTLIGGLVVLKDEIAGKFEEIGNNIMSFLEIDDNGPVIPNAKELIELINIQLEEMGIDKNELNLGNKTMQDTYLYKYMVASMSTKLPYIKTSTAKTFKQIAFESFLGGGIGAAIDKTPKQEVQGIIKIKRQAGEEKIDLDFKKYEDFKKLIDDNDMSALNYFSIDESWKLCVAKSKTVTVNEDSTNEISEVKLPYKTIIDKYSMPFEFFIMLQQITLNPEYVSAVADLILEQGEIEITIFDTVEVITHEYTYKYKVKKKWVEEVPVEKEPYEDEESRNTK